MSKHLNIYGGIGFDIDTNHLIREITSSEEDIVLHVNSPGGDVYDGLAIMNALRCSDCYVTAIVEGLAASAASYIVVGGADRVVMRPTAELMIHQALIGEFGGNADDFEKATNSLKRISKTIATIYQGKAGGLVETWLEAMSKETWFTADEALMAGLCDAVEDGKATKKKFSGDALALMNTYQGRVSSPNSALLRNDKDLGEDMTFVNEIAEKLGIKEDINEETVLAALTEVLNEQGEVEVTKTVVISVDYHNAEVAQEDTFTITPSISEELPEGTTFSVAGEEFIVIDEATGTITVSPTIETKVDDFEYTVTINIPDADALTIEGEVKVLEKPEEVEEETPSEEPTDMPSNKLKGIVLDEETFEELKKAAALGWELKNKLEQEELEREVDTWIKEGRVSASRKNAVLGNMKRDPEAARSLYGSIPVNTIPRSALGSSETGEVSESSVDSARAASLAKFRANDTAGIYKNLK